MLRSPVVALIGLLLAASAVAGMHHYFVTKGATIVSLTIMGPYIMTYVHPNDEPWGVFPYGY